MVEIIIVPDEKTRAKKVSELVEAVKEGKKISIIDEFVEF